MRFSIMTSKSHCGVYQRSAPGVDRSRSEATTSGVFHYYSSTIKYRFRYGAPHSLSSAERLRQQALLRETVIRLIGCLAISGRSLTVYQLTDNQDLVWGCRKTSTVIAPIPLTWADTKWDGRR